MFVKVFAHSWNTEFVQPDLETLENFLKCELLKLFKKRILKCGKLSLKFEIWIFLQLKLCECLTPREV